VYTISQVVVVHAAAEAENTKVSMDFAYEYTYQDCEDIIRTINANSQIIPYYS